MRNRRVLPWVLWPLAAFFFGATIGSATEGAGGGWPVAALGLLVTAGSALLLRLAVPLAPRRRALSALGTAIAARFGELLLLTLVVVFVLANAWSAFTEEAPPFLFLSGLILLAFRLPLPALVAAHVGSLAPGIALYWLAEAKEAGAITAASVIVHAVCCTLGWFLARRRRQRFLADWRQVVTQTRERLRLREELALAREVQLSMLPESVP